MIVASDLPAAVGNTPLIRLRRASEETGCEIWGKAEFLNPGQSVKDRAALFIIRDAERRGKSGCLVAILVFFLSWPLGLILWIVFRPEPPGYRPY